MSTNHTQTITDLPINPAQSYYQLGKALARKQRWKEAIAAYQKALQINPQFLSASQELASIQTQDDRDWASLYDPKDSNGKQFKKDIIFPQNPNNLTRKIQNSETTIESLPAVRDYLQKAETDCDGQDWQGAIDCCRQALNIQPNNAEAYALWGNALYGNRDLETAKQAYLKALEIQPNLAHVCANLGSLYAELEQLEEASACYQKAIAIKPNFPQAYRHWGRIYQRLDRMSEAADCWYRANQLAPQHATPEQHLNLGNLLWQQDKQDAAIQCYQTAIELDPKYVPAYQNLGTALGKQKR
ncbi:MAG: tetratricopeptide repeat protein, partial [Chloroflexi bacterium]